VASWRNGTGVKLAIKRSPVPLPFGARLHNRQVVHTLVTLSPNSMYRSMGCDTLRPGR